MTLNRRIVIVTIKRRRMVKPLERGVWRSSASPSHRACLSSSASLASCPPMTWKGEIKTWQFCDMCHAPYERLDLDGFVKMWHLQEARGTTCNSCHPQKSGHLTQEKLFYSLTWFDNTKYWRGLAETPKIYVNLSKKMEEEGRCHHLHIRQELRWRTCVLWK